MYLKESNQEKISVIVPCKNVEQYLSGALNCLVNQSYQNLEIVCVNDSSTDNTLTILEKYQALYPNKIKVYEMNKQHGCAESRNFGLTKATGEYIAFMDADDLVSTNWLLDSFAYAKHTNLTLIKTKYKNFSSSENKLFTSKMEAFGERISLENTPHRLFEISPSCCCYLIKRSLLEEKPFQEKCCFEDISFTYPLLLHAKEYIELKQVDYLYRRHPNSLSSLTTEPSLHVFDLIDAIQECLKRSSKSEIYSLSRPYLKDNLRFHFFDKYQKINEWNIEQEQKNKLKRIYLALAKRTMEDLLNVSNIKYVLMFSSFIEELENLIPLEDSSEKLKNEFHEIIKNAR